MNFQDLQNRTLQRLRQAGVSWGAAAGNTSANLIPPYWLKLELNKSYNRILALVKDYPVATMRTQLTTAANMQQFSLLPIPGNTALSTTSTGAISPGFQTVTMAAAKTVVQGQLLLIDSGTKTEVVQTMTNPTQPTTTFSASFTLSHSSGCAIANVTPPAALAVYEFSYTQSGGQERYIPFVSTPKFRWWTAAYTQRQAALSAFPDCVCQSFQRRVIDMFPGFATTGDLVNLTICPDPEGTEHVLPGTACSLGGILSADTDVPILPDQFHQMLVEGAVMEMAPDLDKKEIGERAKAAWDEYAEEILEFGSSVGEGDAQQQVIDTWETSFDPQVIVQ